MGNRILNGGSDLDRVALRSRQRSERGAIMGVSDAINSVAMILAPTVGSAIVGANPRMPGVLPACAVLAAFLMGRFPRAAAKAEEAERARRKTG